MNTNCHELDLTVDEAEREILRLEEKKRLIHNLIKEHERFYSAEQRKQRSRRLYTLGGMVEQALGDQINDEYLVGVLLFAAKIQGSGNPMCKEFIKEGHTFLEEKRKMRESQK